MEERETVAANQDQEEMRLTRDRDRDPLTDITIEEGHVPCLIITSCGLARSDEGRAVGVVCPMCGRNLTFEDGEFALGRELVLKCEAGHQVGLWFGQPDQAPDGDDEYDGDGPQIIRVVEQIDGPRVIQGDDCEAVPNSWGSLIGVRCPHCGTAVIIEKDRMADPKWELVRNKLEEEEGREEAERWASSAPKILECRGCHALIATYGWMR